LHLLVAKLDGILAEYRDTKALKQLLDTRD
jgi:hypothetical protein